MTKHRLMLSAAAAALLAAVASAHAQTEINTSTSTALTTATAGDIIINAPNGGIGITAAGPAVTINSNNFVNNAGFIANTGTSDAVGIQIDTSVNSGVLFPPTNGLVSTGTIDLAGGGTGKRGIFVSGGGTYYGPITLTGLSTSGITTQSSSMLIQGDNSVAFWLQQNTKVTGNILLGGSGIIQNASANSQQSNSIVALLDGTVNGNFVHSGSISAAGAGMIGIQVNGGINSCASDAGKPAGFTCATASGGSFVNAGVISLTGTGTPNQRGNNPESGSAVIISSSIAGGFVNAGPGTGSNIPVALIAANGLVTAAGVVQPTILIDPSRSVTALTPAPRGSAILGPVTADMDPVNPGYSFINRGAIQAQPLDAQLSAAALIIQGSSSTYFTCLSASVGTCTGVNAGAPQTNTGGFLSTGDISATALTNITSRTSGTVSAAAIYIGAYSTVPRLDFQQQTVGGTTQTQGTVSAQVSGVGQGTATAITIAENAVVPFINIGRGASITAQVETFTTTPNRDVASASSPFALVSQTIVDQSGSVKLINNAGSITAVNTEMTPSAGTSVVSIQRAIDLTASTTGGTTINNSGVILGDLLFGSAGNNNVLNVGNTGASGTANATGVVNTPSNYAIIGASLISRPTTGVPSANATLLDFGSGTGHQLNVGGFGYLNADIRSGVNALDVTVENNGLLFIANTTTSLQANNFNVRTNGVLGLSISQANLNSLAPVVQANAANLTGANLALQFGTFISSGFTAASVANPTVQTVTLLRAPTIIDTTLADQNARLGQNTPFLFETPAESGIQPLSLGSSGGQQTLLLNLLPRSVNRLNADGSPGLNLSGDAKNQFPFIAAALATDNDLGSAVATSMTIYNTPGVASSGINYAASQQQAQQVFGQFSPDVSGGTREIAILITDQATGPVAARQRLLRQYGKVPGEMTLWGEEFTGQITNKGQVGGAGTVSSFKDHGFGFALGVDGGGPRNGWYGGAFTFYTGDVQQQLPRTSKTNTQWFMLTGYTHWQGRTVFLDTQISAGYGQFNTSRPLTFGAGTRTATSKRAGTMGALGAKGGLMLKYFGVDMDPYLAFDGMTMREEGYTEAGGGTGMNLEVDSYFASSLRSTVGLDMKKALPIWGFELTPGARVGYRYELLQQPVKVKAGFESTGGLATAGNVLTFVGPDPDKGNTLLGVSLGAGTDTWHVGINYDWLRGDNGSTTQVGIISVLGRI